MSGSYTDAVFKIRLVGDGGEQAFVEEEGKVTMDGGRSRERGETLGVGSRRTLAGAVCWSDPSLTQVAVGERKTILKETVEVVTVVLDGGIEYGR